VASVTDSLLAVPGVDGADVDLDTGQARVTGRDLEVARLTEAVEDKGYQVVTAG
jgi:copper chaperone CopZ